MVHSDSDFFGGVLHRMNNNVYKQIHSQTKLEWVGKVNCHIEFLKMIMLQIRNAFETVFEIRIKKSQTSEKEEEFLSTAA